MAIAPYVSQQPVDDFGLRFGLNYTASLAATTDTTLTVPGVAPRYKVLIKCETGSQVWVALNGTAAVPAGGSFAASTSELLTNATPICREVKAGDVLHFYTATASTDVGVTFFGLQTTN